MLALVAAAAAGDTWSTVATGITYLYRTTGDPNQIHVVYVDLAEPTVSIRATREDERQRTTSSFASLVGATVAVNGDWFDYADYYPVGLAVGQGWQWTGQSDSDSWAFVGCNITNECFIDSLGSAWTTMTRVYNAVGGNGAILVQDGAAQYWDDPFYYDEPEPRTAVGIDSTGTMMILVVVDGRSSSSSGMTFWEMNDLMLELGAWDAMMLDGGGSSTMVINGGVQNDPSDGSSRTVSNHLGVISNPYPDSRCASIPNGRYCIDGSWIASCDGGVYSEGDCSYYGAVCEEDGNFAFCTDWRCSNGGNGNYCLDATNIASCTDGVYGEGDCAYYGAACVEGYGSGWCAYTYYQGVVETAEYPFGTPIEVEVGAVVTSTIEIRNTGLSTWTPGVTFLAPVPRDVPSALATSAWPATTRAVTVEAETPAGGLGRFALSMAAPVEGDTTQYFGLMHEGVTWFADYPSGGGPTETEMVYTIRGVPADTLPDTADGSLDDTDDSDDRPLRGGPGEQVVISELCGCGAGSSALLLLPLLWGRRRRG